MKLKKIIQFPLYAVLILTFVQCGSDNSKTESTSGNTSNENKEVAEDKLVAGDVSFTGLLMELETYTGWDAVNSLWKDRREGWLMECQTASDATTKANLMMEFESIVNWSAVDQSWASIREQWLSDCASATSDGELAALLVVFESYILWEAVSTEWAARRELWIADCESL